MTCFAAFRTPGGGWNAESGSLAQRYPALTALFTLLDEAPRVGRVSRPGGESDKIKLNIIVSKGKEVRVLELWQS